MSEAAIEIAVACHEGNLETKVNGSNSHDGKIDAG